MRDIKKGSTDQSTVIRILDSTTFLPETAVEYNTTGIDLWYRRDGATKTSITEAALAALDSAHSDGGIEHIGDGYYRLDLPDAACATGTNGVMIGGTVTDMVVLGTYHALVDHDPYDSVRLGLTALPNAAADAAGGLPISDDGGLDMDALATASALTTVEGKIDTIDNFVDDLESRLGTPSDLGSGATIAANLADIESQTDDIGAAGAGLTALPWNASWDAQVQSECKDALDEYDPPTNSEFELRTLPTADYTIVSDLPSVPTAGDIADAVWDEDLTDHDTADTAGLALSTASTGGVDAGVLAAAVWDKAIADHTDAGTFGAKNQKVVPSETLNDYKATGFSTHSAADVRTELSTELGRIDAAISTRLATAGYTAPANSDITAIKNKTDNLPSDPADQSAVEAAISAISIPTVPTASDIADAVMDEVLPDLSDNALNAGQSMTPRKILRGLFNRFFRKVTQTASAQVVCDDSGDQIASMTVSDDGEIQTKDIAT